MEAPREAGRGAAPWRTMSTEELEKQYSPSRWAVRRGPEESQKVFSDIGIEATARARAARRTLLDVPYGAGEALDIYLPEAAADGEPGERAGEAAAADARPLFVFFHGGYWQAGSKDNSAHMVGPLTARGVVVAVVGYTLAPRATLDQIVDQVARSIVFLQERFPSNQGMYLCGHSAGAHLAAMMLLMDWTKWPVTPNLKGSRGAGGCPSPPLPPPFSFPPLPSPPSFFLSPPFLSPPPPWAWAGACTGRWPGGFVCEPGLFAASWSPILVPLALSLLRPPPSAPGPGLARSCPCSARTGLVGGWPPAMAPGVSPPSLLPGGRDLRLGAPRAHLRERPSAPDPGGCPQEQPPEAPGGGSRAARGAGWPGAGDPGPTRKPRVPQAIPGVLPDAATGRVEGLPGRGRGRGPL